MRLRVFPLFRQQRPLGGEACVSRLVVDKYVYLSKAGTTSVEVWDKRGERMVDRVDCAQIIRYKRATMCIYYSFAAGFNLDFAQTEKSLY